MVQQEVVSINEVAFINDLYRPARPIPVSTNWGDLQELTVAQSASKVTYFLFTNFSNLTPLFPQYFN